MTASQKLGNDAAQPRVSKINGLYLVTDTAIQQQYTHEELAELALKGGAGIVQLRDKQMSARKLAETGRRITELCRSYHAVAVVNDRIDVAYACGAHGVHLGQDDLPIPVARQMLGADRIIGGTASTLDEARQMEADGADYVGFGHIFSTATKAKEYAPRGLDLLREVVATLSIPVVAIGGIDAGSAAQIRDAGASAAAITSAVCCSANPKQAAAELSGLFR